MRAKKCSWEDCLSYCSWFLVYFSTLESFFDTERVIITVSFINHWGCGYCNFFSLAELHKSREV